MRTKRLVSVPLAVSRAMRKLGSDIRDARRRRLIPVAILAERASISRMTLHKIEKGDWGVAIGHYVTVLFALGMIDRVSDIADPRDDKVGLDLQREQLPKRIHLKNRIAEKKVGNRS